MARELALTNGGMVLLDDDDWEWASGLPWYKNVRGYAVRNVRLESGKRSQEILHRRIVGAPEGVQCHHKNGNKLDNRRQNLTLLHAADHTAYERKIQGVRSSNTSGYRGVSWEKAQRCWRADAMAEGSTHFLGYYYTAEDAALARDLFALRVYGPGCFLNFPDAASRSAPEVKTTPRPCGERHAQARLTATDVLEIRKQYKTGRVTYRDLARAFGVSESLIPMIVKGKIWKHLPPAAGASTASASENAGGEEFGAAGEPAAR